VANLSWWKHGKIQLLYKTVYQRKSDIIGFVRSFRSIVVLVYWPTSASILLNQTIKAIDLACELYERRWDSWAFCSGRWDSGDESYLYSQILFTNLKKGNFFTHRSHGLRHVNLRSTYFVSIGIKSSEDWLKYLVWFRFHTALSVQNNIQLHSYAMWRSLQCMLSP
jgi:hypothetical protein